MLNRDIENYLVENKCFVLRHNKNESSPLINIDTVLNFQNLESSIKNSFWSSKDWLSYSTYLKSFNKNDKILTVKLLTDYLDKKFHE